MRGSRLSWGLLVLACTTAGVADEPVRLTTDGLFKQRPAWSPDGKQLIFSRHSGSKIEIWLMSADGSNLRRLTDRQHPEYDASWSPDGKRLAFSLVNVSGAQGDVDVFTIQADSKDLQPFAKTGPRLSHEESPAWSPDGLRIAYTSTRDGNQELYVGKADGTETIRLTEDNALDAHPCWSPDGRRLAWATSRWGDLEIVVADSDGTQLTRLTTSRGLDDYPAWSPDGKWLAFTTHRDGNFEIYRMRPDGSDVSNVTSHEGLDNFPAWSPDGRLTYVSNRDDGFDIYLKKIAP